MIMISSEGSESYIRRAYELGASDYISSISAGYQYDQALCQAKASDPSGNRSDL